MKLFTYIKSFFTRVPIRNNVLGSEKDQGYSLDIRKIAKPYPIYKPYTDVEYVLVGYGRHKTSSGEVKTTMIFQDTSINKEITLSEDVVKAMLYKASN